MMAGIFEMFVTSRVRVGGDVSRILLADNGGKKGWAVRDRMGLTTDELSMRRKSPFRLVCVCVSYRRGFNNAGDGSVLVCARFVYYHIGIFQDVFYRISVE